MSWKRIDKRKARKLYNAGRCIWLLSSKLLFGSMMWGMGCPIVKDVLGYDFDLQVNEFEYYNCDYERGYYAHYYVEESRRFQNDSIRIA